MATEPLFNLTNVGDFLILTNPDPYINVSNILGWEENINISQEANIKREFCWSIDQQTYSEWMSLDNNSNENLNRIRYDVYDKFWINFKITLLTEGLVSVSEIYLLVEHIDLPDKCNIPIPIAYAKEKGNKFYPIRFRPFSYNPYKQNPTIKLQKDLSLIANDLYGHEVAYFRATPDTKSRDVVYLEYSLYGYEEPKCIKILVPKNEFPDNKLNFTNWGVDFEIPFEVNIDKRYWEWVMGINTVPQKRDALYFPLINRMYKIDSSQLVKDFMQEGVFYKLSLVKWVESSNIKSEDKVKKLINDITLDIDKVFGEEILAEEESITNMQQTTDKTTHFDPSREYLYNNDFIVTEKLENFHTIISNHYYDMQKVFIDTGEYKTVIRYKENIKLLKNKNLTYTCWFKNPKSIKYLNKPIENIIIEDNTITIKFKYGLPKINIGQWLEITDKIELNWYLFGEVFYVDQDLAKREIKMIVPDYLLNNANNLLNNWKTRTTLEGKQIPRRNFLYVYKENNLYENKGLIIDVFKNNLIRIIINNNTYWFNILPTIIEEKWYGMVINISNQFNQLGVHLWNIKPNEERTTILNNVFTEIINNLPNIDVETNTKFEIKSSNLHLTNIRILSEPIEQEKQSQFLNQNIIKDSHLGIVIDNAIPQMKLPYMGQVK